MKRTSIESFKAEVAQEAKRASLEAAARAKAEETKATARLECTRSGIAVLFGAAMLDLTIQGFPPEIDLSSSNGHNAGLMAKRSGGVWRLQGSDDALHKASIYSFGLGYLTWIAGPGLAAMGMRHSPEGIQRLQVLLKLAPGDTATLAEVAKLVPEHTMAAAIGLGRDAAATFGFEWKDIETFFKSALTVARNARLDLSSSPAGIVPPLIALASRGEAGLLSYALSQGFLRTNVSAGSHTAARAAVDAGRHEALQVLHRHGERLDVVDQCGDTLLHANARLVGTDRAFEAPAIARFLVGKGVDPSAVNSRGETAADIASDLSRAEDAADGSEEAREAFDAAIEASSKAPGR